MNIRIADLPIAWQDDFSDFVSSFKDESDDEPVITVSFAEKMPECHGVQYADTQFNKLLRQENGELLLADSGWREVTAYFASRSGEYALPLAAICSRFSAFGAVLAHASLVEYDGCGIMFTGHSGVGKTTQAQLWNKFKKAEIINGDKALIRCMSGGVYACGLPWKGSSPYCINRNVPLKTVVVLGQAKKNSVKLLSSADAAAQFLPHVFLPHWDKECMEDALDTFERILKKVSVVLLECRPDEDAVNLLHGTVLK